MSIKTGDVIEDALPLSAPILGLVTSTDDKYVVYIRLVRQPGSCWTTQQRCKFIRVATDVERKLRYAQHQAG